MSASSTTRIKEKSNSSSQSRRRRQLSSQVNKFKPLTFIPSSPSYSVLKIFIPKNTAYERVSILIPSRKSLSDQYTHLRVLTMLSLFPTRRPPTHRHVLEEMYHGQNIRRKPGPQRRIMRTELRWPMDGRKYRCVQASRQTERELAIAASAGSDGEAMSFELGCRIQ